MERIKERKCCIKIIPDLGGLVKVFSILGSTESLFRTLSYFWFFLVFQWSIN